MPTKLKFKGEKPKKRKREKEEDKLSKERKVENGEENEEEVRGWATAKEEDELVGPILILSTMAVCLASDPEGTVYATTELDQVDDSERVVDRLEPNSRQQVFTVMRLELGKQRKYAFKTRDRYLTIGSDGVVSAKAAAVGPRESFMVEKRENDWCVSIDGKYLVINDQEVKSSDAETTLVMRIQAQHAIKSQEPVSAEKQVTQRISTQELVKMTGRKLRDNEVRTLKKAYKQGKLNEALLDVRQKSSSDTRC